MRAAMCAHALLLTLLHSWCGCCCCCDRESETDTIFEYLVDDARGAWQHWASCVPQWTYPAAEERPKFAQLVIPTLDSVRCVASSGVSR